MAPTKPRSRRLTAREKQVIALVAEGLTSTEIGRVFKVSHWSADHWRSSANVKLGARNPAHLVHLAYTAEAPKPVLPFNARALATLLRKLDANR